MAISDLIKVTKSKIKQYYDSQNVMQCSCRLHSCNHGKIVKTSTKTKKFNVLLTKKNSYFSTEFQLHFS